MYLSSQRRANSTFPALLAVLVVDLLTIFTTNFDAQVVTPFEQGWQSGRPMTVTGELTLMYADDFANRRVTLVHIVRDERTGKTFELRFEKEAPTNLSTGARIQIAGRAYGSGKYGSELFIAGCCDSTTTSPSSSLEQTTSQLAAQSTADQPTIVIVANFRDTSVSCSIDTINNAMFADPNGKSAAALYRDNSRGQVSLSGQVVGPYTIDFASTDACGLDRWTTAAQNAATTAGVNLAGYQHRVFVMPPNSCSGSGLGSIGGLPSYAWIFACDITGGYAHEIGHNLGMDHAATPTSEYGDASDPMASADYRLPGLNAPHRHQLGWLGQNSTQLSTQDGLYNIAPLALDPALTTGPQALQIAKRDTQEYYYLSYRQPVGYDRYISLSSIFYDTLYVHRYKGDGSSTLTTRLAMLADGESFVDPVNGITVSLASHNASYATAQVHFDCAPTTPSLNLSPTAQTGAAGSNVSYAASVTNDDAQPCSARTFALNGAVPAGWAGTLSSASLTLDPGATGQATFTVTSAPGAPAGTYAATVAVADTASASATSATATYTVLTPPDTMPPSAPTGLTVAANKRLKQIQLSWKAATDNIAVAGYRISRNGVLVGTSTTTAWTDQTWSAGAAYTYSVAASDAAGNVSPSSNSVTVTVAGGGTGKK
jgi:Gametolysin peptidase M11/NPCBM-associated, NEW3 domain of alpha-galactosidase